MPVMTKTPKGEEIVILSREEYDRLVAAAAVAGPAATGDKATTPRVTRKKTKAGSRASVGGEYISTILRSSGVANRDRKAPRRIRPKA